MGREIVSMRVLVQQVGGVGGPDDPGSVTFAWPEAPRRAMGHLGLDSQGDTRKVAVHLYKAVRVTITEDVEVAEDGTFACGSTTTGAEEETFMCGLLNGHHGEHVSADGHARWTRREP